MIAARRVILILRLLRGRSFSAELRKLGNLKLETWRNVNHGVYKITQAQAHSGALAAVPCHREQIRKFLPGSVSWCTAHKKGGSV